MCRDNTLNYLQVKMERISEDITEITYVSIARLYVHSSIAEHCPLK
jgi:hypothetical protein